MAAPKDRKNPYTAFNFKFEIIGNALSNVAEPVTTGAFMECSGLDGENSPIEYREGIDQVAATAGNFVRKLAGMERYPNVTLRRGITGHTGLWKWRELVRDSPATRDNYVRDVRITLNDENHAPVMSWTLKSAWPAKLSGPSLNAKSNELAVESLELCCERILIDLT
jgi:phage tail-like protein